MRKTDSLQRFSVRVKLKHDHVELCIIQNNTGAIQYEVIPLDFEVKEDNGKKFKSPKKKEETEQEDVKVDANTQAVIDEYNLKGGSK